MPFTTPADRIHLEEIDHLEWNQDVVDNINFFGSQKVGGNALSANADDDEIIKVPSVAVRHSAGQLLDGDEWTALNWNDDVWDTHDMHSTGPGNETITIPLDGLWLIHWQSRVDLSPIVQGLFISVYINSVLSQMNDWRSLTQTGTKVGMAWVHSLNAGDEIELWSKAGGGTTQTIQNSVPGMPQFGAHWLGALP